MTRFLANSWRFMWFFQLKLHKGITYVLYLYIHWRWIPCIFYHFCQNSIAWNYVSGYGMPNMTQDQVQDCKHLQLVWFRDWFQDWFLDWFLDWLWDLIRGLFWDLFRDLFRLWFLNWFLFWFHQFCLNQHLFCSNQICKQNSNLQLFWNCCHYLEKGIRTK